MKLNIGSGLHKREGYINIDRAPQVNPDIIMDIENGINFPDNTFDEIYTSQALEHIVPGKFKFVLEEIARVAKHGCKLHMILPFDNMKCRTNSDHFRTFTWWSFINIEHDSPLRYFSKLTLKRAKPFPNKLIRTFFMLFPIFKLNIEFFYDIVKLEKHNER